MVIWNWGPWRQVEIISRAVSNITANGLGFQHSGGLGVSHKDLYWLPFVPNIYFRNDTTN